MQLLRLQCPNLLPLPGRDAEEHLLQAQQTIALPVKIATLNVTGGDHIVHSAWIAEKTVQDTKLH